MQGMVSFIVQGTFFHVSELGDLGPRVE